MAEKAHSPAPEDHSDVSSVGNGRQPYPPDHSDENEACKIIVLQLSFNSTEDTVHEYFSQFGDIEKLDLKRYPDGSSRGFAFIVYVSEDSIDKVLSTTEHMIDKRKVTVEKAKTRSEKMQTSKIFIGKLPSELTEESLRIYFSRFGEVDEVQFVFNKQTNNERKSFCFIQFKSPEAVEKITESKVPPDSTRHTIDGFEIECKKKFEDNHPIQRKIKAIERQKKGWDYYGGGYQGNGAGSNYGNYDPNYNSAGYGYGYGNYGGGNYGGGRNEMYQGNSYNGGYGHDDYNMYSGYYNGHMAKQGSCGRSNSHNTNGN